MIGGSPGLGEARPARVSDPYSVDLVLSSRLPELLAVFNQAGVLAPADVHTALRLGRLAGEERPEVLLAAALAVRGPRVGHVSVDLHDVRESVVVGEEDVGVDVESLPWPERSGWLEQISVSPLVAGADEERPLRLVGSALYLDRYWRDEVALAGELLARAGGAAGPPPDPGDLERLFPGAVSVDQRRAAAISAARPFSVIAGGPGTGKTTAVARLLALLCESAAAAGRRPPLVALAAPTGKAAARMEEAVRAESARLDTSDEVRTALAGLAGATLHRLLGTRPDRPGSFRHHRGHRLPHEVVVVDEASMVSLSLMARLVEAVRPDARLILVGDPEQLVSVEAGAVLADIVQPTPGRTVGTASASASTGDRPASPMASCISVLRTNHRFGGSLARLSEAVRSGDTASVLAILESGDEAVGWEDADPEELVEGSGSGGAPLERLTAAVTQWGAAIHEAASAGDIPGAVAALRAHRVLCAHRRGPAGVAVWNRRIEEWLAGRGVRSGLEGSWYPGRPVLVTANDYGLRLFNGDTGVTIARPGPSGRAVAPGGADSRTAASLGVAFDAGSAPSPPRVVSPSRLDAVETVYAMTVHKSQGSEFDRVTLLLPNDVSRLLTRELLYTALTRARRGVLVVGRRQAIVRAVERPIARASGLGARLWGAGQGRAHDDRSS
jgi:exodeoxyribonuclease V alpha subunit